MQGYKFIPFPKPKTDLEKCLRWITACGRPYDQLNVNRINKHKAVCSKHFIGGNGPTEQYPDPIQADGSAMKPKRPKTVRRSPVKGTKRKQKLTFASGEQEDFNEDQPSTSSTGTSAVDELNKDSQTDELWVSPMDVLALTVECHELKSAVAFKDKKIQQLEATIQDLNNANATLKNQLAERGIFSVESVLHKEEKVKGLFKYYTAITHVRFLSLFSFLIPPDFSLDYRKERTDLKKFSQEDRLFLVLARQRHNFGLKDIAMRFEISVQSASSLFNTWIDHMYFKFGQLSIWPLRDTIIEKMPKEFRSYFPNTLVIIDGT